MPGALAQLPDATALTRLAAGARAQADVLAGGYRELARGGAASPLAPLSEALAGVGARAQVDIDGVASSVQRALGRVQAGLPPAVLEYVAALEGAYRSAVDELAGHPLLELVPEGGALRDVGMQVIDEAVESFTRRAGALAAGAVDTAALREVTGALELLARVRSDPAGHAAEVPELVATAVLGFRPGTLDPLRVHLSATTAVVAELDDSALSSTVGPLRTAAGQALSAVTAAIESLDPAAAAGYAAISAALDAVAGVVTEAAGVLTGLYDGVAEGVAAHPWDRVMPAYLELLRQVDLSPQLLLDTVIDASAQLLDDLVSAAQAAVAADDLVERIEAFAGGLRAAVAGSGIGQLRSRLVGVLGDLRDAVTGVPLEAVREAVVGLLGRVGDELERLDLDGAAGQIEAALAELETLAIAAAEEAGTAVQEALDAVLGTLDSLPVDDLVAALQGALTQVDGVITTVQTGAAAHLDALRSQLEALESVSFRPVGDAVVGEIDEIRARLAAMSPNALSAEEQLAVRAAIAVFEAIDLEGTIATQVTSAFRSLQSGVVRVLDDIAAALERLRRVFAELDPGQLVEPVTGGLARVRAEVDRLDAPTLLAPARAEVQRVNAALARLAPGALLAPLHAPFDGIVAAIDRLDPDDWGAFCEELHGDLVALVDRVDVSALFAELDERRRGLLASTREALAQGVQALALPAPLDAWFARVRPLLEDVTELLFSDPGESMRQLAPRVAAEFSPSSLYEPLDAVFDEIVAAVEAIPAGDLVEAATGVRDQVVDLLDLLEPVRLRARLRAAHRRLVDASAASVLPAVPTLTAARAAFRAKVDVAVSTPAGEVARVTARFDTVITLVDPARAGAPAAALRRAHDRAMETLTGAVERVDLDAAQREWQRVRGQLDRLVPAVLLEPGPLTAARVVAACESWRPAERGTALDERLEAFLATLAPLAERLDGALVRFTDELRDAVGLLDPLALDEAVVEVVDAVRDQVDALAPGPVLDALRSEVWLPIRAAVTALDPRLLAERLDAAYASARGAVERELDALLDRVEQAVGEHLRRVRSAVAAVLGGIEAVVRTSTAAVGDLLGRVDRLVFVELLTRLRTLITNLGTDFDAELARIRTAFDAMLAAAPVAGRTSAAGVGGGS